jgi:hypothetical protein
LWQNPKKLLMRMYILKSNHGRGENARGGCQPQRCR